jgi:thiamine biosynthesis lipoprotein
MNRIQRARPLLGTIAQITVVSALAPAELHAAVDSAFAEIARVHSLMSWHDSDSELSRLNLHAAVSMQPLSAHTRAVLAASLEFSRLSAGAFDPCVGARLARSGLLPHPAASPLSPEFPPPDSCWRDVELTADGVRFHRPLWLDFGGIAKGYAVDLAVQSLLRSGVQDIVVNAGGDLRVAGPRAHPIGIRHPHSAHALAHELLLDNEALATSAAFVSQRAGPGGPVCALVDPLTGNAYAGQDSVSVRAANCMTADALSKIALFAPPAVAEKVFLTCQAHCIRLAPDQAT